MKIIRDLDFIVWAEVRRRTGLCPILRSSLQLTLSPPPLLVTDDGESEGALLELQEEVGRG